VLSLRTTVQIDFLSIPSLLFTHTHTGCEADHSPPSSAEAKECVELYLHSPIPLHDMVLS